MAKGDPKQERRSSRRFQVAWELSVKGTDKGGDRFSEVGRLENLSSGGAFFCLRKRVNLGATLELRIKVPFNKENWMKYSAEVVRVEKADAAVGVAVRFEKAHPIFIKH